MAVNKRKLNSLGISMLSLFLVMAWQNCSNVKLNRVIPSLSNGANDESAVSYLPKPNFLPAYERLVILLDMSHSAILGPCSGDVDLPAPGNTCGVGYDPYGIRFAWVQKWLDEFIATSSANSDIKVFIIPFSGGNSGIQTGNTMVLDKPTPLTNVKNWVSPADAKTAISLLEQFQKSDLNPIYKTHNLGTTVFGPALSQVDQVVGDYIQNNASQVGQTKFDVVLISDGVPRPREFDLRNFMGQNMYDIYRGIAPMNCDTNPMWLNCAQAEQSACTFINSSCSGVRAANFGDPVFNDPSSLLETISTTAGRGIVSGLGRLNIFLLQPNMPMITANALVDENTKLASLDNPDLNIWRLFEFKLRNPVKTSNTTTPPITLSSSFFADGRSYRIADFMVINLNARIDQNGNLVTDSDADGIPDDVEITNGTDPTVARSNNYCLDGITALGGCKMLNCDPHRDTDGDGLNNCEEDTLNLNSTRFSTLIDDIPDLYRFLYGQSFSRDNSNTDDSSDGIMNKEALKQGAVAGADLSGVPANQMVSVSMTFLGENSSHQPEYKLRIKNVPLMQTRAVTTSFDLYKSAGVKIANADTLGGTSHGAGINQIVVLIHAVSTTGAPQSFWFIKRFDVDYKNPVLPPLNLSQFDAVDQFGG